MDVPFHWKIVLFDVHCDNLCIDIKSLALKSCAFYMQIVLHGGIDFLLECPFQVFSRLSSTICRFNVSEFNLFYKFTFSKYLAFNFCFLNLFVEVNFVDGKA
jgi:hypothetical protein